MVAVHTPRVVPFADKEAWLGLRNSTIGGSEVAALFEACSTEDPVPEEEGVGYEQDGQPVSPYASPLSLWALKTGKLQRVKTENERIRWGHILEPIVAEAIATAQGWRMRNPPGYFIHPTIPGMGASLDREIDEGDGIWRPFEIKTVSDAERWKWRNSVGEIVLPMHILLQVQHQLAVTGLDRAYVGVLFGGSEERLITVERDDAMIAELEAAVADFWQRVADDNPPEPNPDRDLGVLRRLYQHIDPTSVLDWRTNEEARALVAEYQRLGSRMGADKKDRERLQAQIWALLGNAEAADLGDALVKTSLTEASSYMVNRQASRTMRITKPKTRHGGRALAQIHAE